MDTDTLFDSSVAGMKSQVAKFDGHSFEANLDGPRLTAQLDRVREYMLDIFPAWKSVFEISESLNQLYEENFPTQSISARLRDLRKKQFGSYAVDKKRRTNGTWEYLVYRS